MSYFINSVAFYCFFVVTNEVMADVAQTSKGEYPFMAFLYYPDTSVRVDDVRFFQAAILFKPDMLISASLKTGNDRFPIKTLMARVGVVDVNFNEDENEQEREIIGIVHPFHHNMTNKWSTDVSLLKTLLPFNISDFVKPTELDYSFKTHEIKEESCKILAFMRVTPESSVKSIIQIPIELSQPNAVDCGPKFNEKTMACGVEDYRNGNLSNGFCLDNAGGPLICGKSVVGLQNYIEGEPCQSPRLYQLVSGWKKFINCGTLNDCRNECSEICKVVPKDLEVVTSETYESVSLDDNKYTGKPTRTGAIIVNTSRRDVEFRAQTDNYITEKDIIKLTEMLLDDDSVTTTTQTKITNVQTDTTTDKTVTTTTVLTNVTTEIGTTMQPDIFVNLSIPKVTVESRRTAVHKHRRSSAENIDFDGHVLFTPIILKFLI